MLDFKFNKKDKNNNEIDIDKKLNMISNFNNFKNMSRYEKMSLLIIVLLQMINNDTRKLENMFQVLNKQNILDIKLIGEEYKQTRMELHNIIQTFSNNNNLNNIHTNYLQHYNKVKTIGNGAYSSVYKIYNKLERKSYALKKIYITDDLIDSEFSVFREIRLLCDLNHHNIVKYHTSWINIENNNANLIQDKYSELDLEFDPKGVAYNAESNSESDNDYDNYVEIDDEYSSIKNNIPTLYIQMELCDSNFREYLLTDSLNDSMYTRISYFKQILNAVKYIHDKNIIHRDIKPENILMKYNDITQFYTIKLGDFGLCKKINDDNNIDDSFSSLVVANNNIKNSNMHNYIGTGVYRDPALDNNVSSVNHKSIDIYALGIILFEICVNCSTMLEKSKLLTRIRSNPEFIKNINDKCMITDKYNDLIFNMLIPGNTRYDINTVIEKIEKIIV